jgi:hypothetical protein
MNLSRGIDEENRKNNEGAMQRPNALARNARMTREKHPPLFRNAAQDDDNPRKKDRWERREKGKKAEKEGRKWVVMFSTADWS